ncbi:glycosyltransferase family 4 protein [Noviherbaspirillum soli]|uniref:glycosyltransferase family 4 protein n=1 Tax=Noviherbaspirillum soli TaxID=1064518 RepID=UPI00188B285F|nr:glycosyltransferase family 4 protein [Noviherbaspirillum soli]
MKLLIYLHSLESGGAERVAANLANHWARKGWQVTIATVEAIERDFYELDPRVARIGFGLSGDSRGIVEAAIRNVARIRRLRAAIRDIQPDAALAMMTNANVVLALACRGLPRFCAVGSEHIYPAQVSVGRVWDMLRRMHYRDLHAVAALTPECRKWIMRNTSAKQAPVIPNAAGWPLPLQEPVLPPDSLCKPGRRILLGVGRLSYQKNFPLLIDVFARLAPRNPDWDLVILGAGPDHEALRAQAAERGLSERVFLPGVVGNLRHWYERADLYVMSSHFEGFPNTLAEALAHGLPAVSVDCDTGPRDIIRHGVDGLLAPVGDSSALEEALNQVMADGAQRAQFAARAVEARERFSMERVAGMWESLFSEPLGVDRPALSAPASARDSAY